MYLFNPRHASHIYLNPIIYIKILITEALFSLKEKYFTELPNYKNYAVI